MLVLIQYILEMVAFNVLLVRSPYNGDAVNKDHQPIGQINETFGKTIFQGRVHSARLLVTSPVSNRAETEWKIAGPLYEVLIEYIRSADR